MADVSKKIILAMSTLDCLAAESVIECWAHETDRHHACRQSNPRRTKQSLLGRSLLRGLLDQIFAIDGRDWRVLANSDGKPYVCSVDREPGPAISISHSDSLVAVAVTQLGALGIDIEKQRRRRAVAAIAERAFGSLEKVEAAQDVSAFYRIWALREALSKASGRGLIDVVNGRNQVAGGPYIGTWRNRDQDQSLLLAHFEPCREYSLGIAVIPALQMPSFSWSPDSIEWREPFVSADGPSFRRCRCTRL